MRHARYIKYALCLLLIGLIGTATATGQNLLNNRFYREAEQVKQQSRNALDNGNFALSINLAQRSRELSALAYEYAEELYFAFVARAARLRAGNKLDFINRSTAEYTEAEQIGIEDSRGFYRDGTILFDEEQYELGALSFLSVTAVLKEVGVQAEQEYIVQVEPSKDIAPEPPEPAPVDPPAQVLPRFYRVRLIIEDRDSFSKISAYPFVYGRYQDWPTLYEKNKDKIVDSENPNLIHPGQLFEIPSLRGEVREGEWQPPLEQ